MAKSDADSDAGNPRSAAEPGVGPEETHSAASDDPSTTVRWLAAAARRDEVALVRDLTAAIRDRTAESRDHVAGALDDAGEERDAVGGGDLVALATRERARRVAAFVRERSAAERTAAAADRIAAAMDRGFAAEDRRNAGLDELTGVFRRGAGELALRHEIDRSRRSGRPLVLAIIDVDALKAVNDRQGHTAGDALLRDVPSATARVLRSYDVAVRWGGDEFICTLYDVRLPVALTRISEVRGAFERLRTGASISVGLAELADEDTLASLISRADADLYRSKATRNR